MAVHHNRGQVVVNPLECLSRYAKISKDTESLYQGVVSHKAQFEEDDGSKPPQLNQQQSWEATRMITKLLESSTADLRRIDLIQN